MGRPSGSAARVQRGHAGGAFREYASARGRRAAAKPPPLKRVGLAPGVADLRAPPAGSSPTSRAREGGAGCRGCAPAGARPRRQGLPLARPRPPEGSSGSGASGKPLGAAGEEPEHLLHLTMAAASSVDGGAGTTGHRSRR